MNPSAVVNDIDFSCDNPMARDCKLGYSGIQKHKRGSTQHSQRLLTCKIKYTIPDSTRISRNLCPLVHCSLGPTNLRYRLMIRSRGSNEVCVCRLGTGPIENCVAIAGLACQRNFFVYMCVHHCVHCINFIRVSDQLRMPLRAMLTLYKKLM